MFSKIKKRLDGKRVLILGYGKEGRSTLSFIRDYLSCESITVADKRTVEDELLDGVNTVFGDSYMDDLLKYDVIIKSPGVVYPFFNDELKNKTTSQTELFLEEFSKQTVGITGTKGKSTTTTLIHHILTKAGIHSVLTGNIGIPPLDSAREMRDDSVAVFEMSCHQLEFLSISPRVAIILNLFEDHLDHYGTRDKYVKAKENIFLNQNESNVFIVWDECTEQIKKATSKVVTVGNGDDAGYTLRGEKINNKLEIPEDIKLIGEHNRLNVTFAYAATNLFGVSDEVFLNSLKSFSPLPHRLEFVAKKSGVEYYDDSISTIPQTTIQAVKSLKNVETLILGGMDRGIDYSELIDFLSTHKIKNVLLTYKSGERIGRLLSEKNVPFYFCTDLNEAVLKAKMLTSSGGKCLLSPASASYGYFRNFEERGDRFKELVHSL